ncbi:Alcohol dehydrogenase [Sinorhizobium alkalisoli]|nr:Alcohol dehydrogenase [Sinorhizobium alkalisoli]
MSAGYLVGAERGVIGSVTGSAFEKTLDSRVPTAVRPTIETMPLERPGCCSKDEVR